MVFALSTGSEIALAVTAAIFVGFALTSAFVIPRRSPNFPGRGLGWYVVASVALFVAMLTTVLVFGKEKEAEPASAETPAGQSTTASTETATSVEAPTTTAAAPAAGDAAAGKKVFASAGCTGCHTLKAAGATGTVGPNLDEAKPDESLIKDRVEHGKGPMPAFGDSGQLSKQQIDDVVAFVYSSTHA
jgi:mono/diheme cytochrome c family protein